MYVRKYAVQANFSELTYAILPERLKSLNSLIAWTRSFFYHDNSVHSCTKLEEIGRTEKVAVVAIGGNFLIKGNNQTIPDQIEATREVCSLLFV